MNIIEKTPLPISGLMLALFSIGTYLENFVSNISIVFAIIALTILILIILKIVFYNKTVIYELKNVIVCSSFGTFSMGLMMFSTYFLKINHTVGFIIWLIGILLHILLIIYFTKTHIINNYNLSKVYPTYCIVYIGITIGSITGFNYMPRFNMIFFLFGFLSMIPTISIVSYRYYKLPIKENMEKPLICIYTAIFSILLVGYVNSFKISYTFITVLYLIACIFYILSFYKFLEYIKMEFYPSFSAFSFPFVISVVATYNMYLLFNSKFLLIILIIETLIACFCVFFVLIKFIRNIYITIL